DLPDHRGFREVENPYGLAGMVKASSSVGARPNQSAALSLRRAELDFALRLSRGGIPNSGASCMHLSEAAIECSRRHFVSDNASAIFRQHPFLPPQPV